MTARGDRSDVSLLRDHVEGDPDAFAELVQRHRDRLWAVALRTTADPEEASDAVQDALISAFRRAETFRGDAQVTTWLHRIVVNACLDRMRRRASKQTEPLPDDDRSRELATPAGDDTARPQSGELTYSRRSASSTRTSERPSFSWTWRDTRSTRPRRFSAARRGPSRAAAHEDGYAWCRCSRRTKGTSARSMTSNGQSRTSPAGPRRRAAAPAQRRTRDVAELAHPSVDDLADLAQGLLADQRLEAVSAHLATCGDCAAAAAALDEVQVRLADAGSIPEPMPQSVSAALDAALRQASADRAAGVTSLTVRRSAARPRSRRWAVLAAAAAAVVVLGYAGASLLHGGGKDTTSSADSGGGTAPMNSAAGGVASGSNAPAGRTAAKPQRTSPRQGERRRHSPNPLGIRVPTRGQPPLRRPDAELPRGRPRASRRQRRDGALEGPSRSGRRRPVQPPGQGLCLRWLRRAVLHGLLSTARAGRHAAHHRRCRE